MRRALSVLILIAALGGYAFAQPAPKAVKPPAPVDIPEESAPVVRAPGKPAPKPAVGVAGLPDEPGLTPEDLGPERIEAPPTPAVPAPPKPAVPTTRARFPVAIVQVVDKITTETNRFEVHLDRPVQYKSLIFTLHACEATAPDERDRDYVAHMEVDFQPPTPQGKPKPARHSVFKGWMYASSPSVSPLEHPIYDAWLIECKTDAPVASSAPKPAAAPR